MTSTPTNLGRSAVRMIAFAAAVAAASAAVAQTAPSATPTQPEAPQAAPAPRRADTPEARKAAMAALEARYVVPPSVADDFGLRIVWQTEPLATKGATGQVAVPGSDSYWFGDSAGSVVRIRRDNGETVWRASTNQGIERMLTIEHLPAGRQDNVYVVTEMASITLDAGTGNLVRRSRFAHLPSCTPAVYGPTFIYGTGTGLASWFQYGTGYNWRATTLGGRVTAPVTVSGQVALAGSTNGTVHAMDAATAGVRWTRRLTAGVEAPIAVGNDACYVASRDQSLWAFDLDRGRVLWQYFTQTPLLNPPAVVGDGLYLQIPGEGLVSFNPLPAEKPEGEVRWKSKAEGTVIGRMGTDLLCWNAGDRALTAVDAGTGRVVRTAKLPKAEVIRLTSPMDGDLLVMSKEGSVQRLETLGRAPFRRLGGLDDLERTVSTVAADPRIRRALVSVSDKSGVVEFARGLAALGVEIVSTGGTAAALAAAGVPVVPIEDVTGFPEMMDGRVKTLHPRVHGGLLGVRSNAEHLAAMEAHGIRPIDLVCVNLYPFEATIAKPGIGEHDAIENIDIGGPSMLRSAAKNFESVTVVTEPAQYPRVLEAMRTNAGATTLALRREFAQAVFARTAAYDGAIARWMGPGADGAAPASDGGHFPRTATLRLELVDELRYGENPHQRGAVYADPAARGPSVVRARLLHGKPLSYNNLLDAGAALELVQDLALQRTGASACAVIKHTNPCGAALADGVLASFERAWAGDPLAAFGGIVAFSRTVDAPTAEAMAAGERFLEVVIAPGYEPKALETLQARWKNARLLAVGELGAPAHGLSWRSVPGGMLAQDRDAHPIDPAAFAHAAGPAPDAAMRSDAGVLFTVAKHLKSNAVCIGAGGRLFGAGAGQMDRVASCRNAVEKARAALAAMPAGHAALAASDAFFPFADGPTLLADAGVRCIVHPGGSKRDQDTFDLCNARGVTCLLTGTRHFRH